MVRCRSRAPSSCSSAAIVREIDDPATPRSRATAAKLPRGTSASRRDPSRGAKRVYAAARRPQSLENLARESNGRVVPIALDVTQPQQAARAAAEAGDVSLLINNAGSLVSFGLLQASRDQLQTDLDVNYFGALETTKAFVPVLEKNAGTVVNVLTMVSHAPMPSIGGYSASKAAAWSMTQALRAELAGRNVSVHGVYPGPVDTDMIRDFELTKASPLDVANAVFDGVEAGLEDIYPDAMSRGAADVWRRDPKALERQFAAM